MSTPLRERERADPRYEESARSRSRRGWAVVAARTTSSGGRTIEDRAEAWRQRKRDASARLDGLVEPVLAGAARRSWGKGLFRAPWQIVRRPDDVVWRAYRYL